MRDFIKRYWKFLILALSIFIFAIVTHKLLNQELTDGFDTHIHDFVISFETPILTFFFKFVTFLSSAPFLIILSFLLFFIFKNKKYGLLSLINLVAIVTVNQILKYAFSRPRPLEWMLIEESGFSFPSGHAMVSAAFYGMLIYLIWQTKVSKRQKKIWTIVLAILVFLKSLSLQSITL